MFLLVSRIFSSILDTIGKTPVVHLQRLSRSAPNSAQIYAKCEFFNPLSSVKDRLAFAVLHDALKRGVLAPGQTVVEATSGNTGVGLAMVCAALGHPLVVTMSESFSVERRKVLRALGAQVILTPAAGRGTAMVAKAAELASKHGWFQTNQFRNPANVSYHSQTTASEILLDFAGKPLDWFVSGFGTAGTFIGVGQMLRVARPDVKLALSEPETAKMVASGLPQERNQHGESAKTHPAFTAPHPVQGWTPDFIPLLLEEGLKTVKPDMLVGVSGAESIAMSHRLAREEGIFTGISGGASVASAFRVAAASNKKNLHILTVLPDTAERYLSSVLFENISADMNEQERKIAESTPSHILEAKK